ncbi:MAG TPA: phosphopentomutase [candidate division Zixibacteria bacterium]|nr:phosphopentomutase [candidate division Zixibacteria bacterium]
MKRAIIIIIDACGVGELPDAATYGDEGSSTLPHVAEAVGGLKMPACTRLGLGNIVPIQGVPPQYKPGAAFGKMTEQSAGKDSTTGHWEIAGLITPKPFPVFPNGFPPDLVAEFERRAGIKTMANHPASGTEIIKELGERHLQTGEMILYTSADSVFQLAAHEDLYPPEKLYQICTIARELLQGEFAVGRVIARPFVGSPGNFTRTAHRRDFSLEPPSATLLDLLQKAGHSVFAVGKISDLFAGRGVNQKVKTANNMEVMDAVVSAVDSDSTHQMIFANCVDFDEKWGHRNDEKSFANGLEMFDERLDRLLPTLRQDDMLIITADHGCDPTIKTSTDHSREYVPLLVYGAALKRGVDLGTRGCFCDVACTLAEWFGIRHNFPGNSFLGRIVDGDRK